MTGSIAGLFKGPVYEREALRNRDTMIRWWEERRLFYNKAVGAVGALAVILTISCGVIFERFVGEPIGIPDPPVLIPLGILAYAVMANVCYTTGWITELMPARFRPPEWTNAFGRRAFSLGVRFSVGLTIFPALVCWGVFLSAVVIGTPLPHGGN